MPGRALWTGPTIRVINTAGVLIIVPQGSNTEGSLAIMLLDAVPSSIIRDSSISPVDLTRPGLARRRRIVVVVAATRAVRAASGIWCLFGFVPIVVGAHSGSVLVLTAVLLDEVPSQGVAACACVFALDPGLWLTVRGV